jgi:hypothetical protein
VEPIKDGRHRSWDFLPTEREALELELHPLEELTCFAIDVLFRVENVAPTSIDEVGHSRDNSRLIVA